MKALPRRKGNNCDVAALLVSVHASMKALPRRKGNFDGAAEGGGALEASMKALPRRKGNHELVEAVDDGKPRLNESPS